MKFNLLIHFHMYDIKLKNEFLSYLKNVEEAVGKENIGLIVTVPDDVEEDDPGKGFEEISNHLFLLPYDNNKYGTDIHAFFIAMKKALDEGIEAQYLLKIHTKSDPLWRSEMLGPLIGSKASVKNNINILESKTEIGLIGPYKYLHFIDFQNYETVSLLCKKYELKNPYIFDDKFYEESEFNHKLYVNIPENYDLYGVSRADALGHWTNFGKGERRISSFKMYEEYVSNNFSKFVAGTCFYASFEPFYQFFLKYDPLEILKSLESGFLKNYELNPDGSPITRETVVHAWERLFGVIVYTHSKKAFSIGLSLKKECKLKLFSTLFKMKSLLKSAKKNKNYLLVLVVYLIHLGILIFQSLHGIRTPLKHSHDGLHKLSQYKETFFLIE